METQASKSFAGIKLNQDFGYGLSTESKAPQSANGELKPGQSQASRALSLAGYFVSGCMAINASQFLGAPLYLVNQDWYNAWIAFTKQSWGLLTMTMTQWWAPTIVRVSGDSTMRGQLLQTTDGSLICNFPERMILIANHQIYTDWLYLWWIGYAAGMHGRIYVVLKESLKRIPVIGWGMQFAQFIFLKRKWEQDKPRMAAHLQRFNNPKDPMWLMMFPEGTNLADSTRESSKHWAAKNGIEDMQYTLLPRSTGLQFILQELRSTVDYVYDCTIAYEGVPRGEFAQDIFTVGASYFGGRPPKSVNMYWRRFRVSSIPLDDSKKFELWLRQRWLEKDKFIEDYLCTGRFPADKGSGKDSQGKTITGAGHIEADIKPKYWYEFLQVFAPIGLFALVLYMFYGALPTEVLSKIKSIDQRTVLKKIAAYQRGEIKIPDQKKLKAIAAKALKEQQMVGGSKLRNAALAHGVGTLNGVPQKSIAFKRPGVGTGKKVNGSKKLPEKSKPALKLASKPKPVTLNGVPLKDFTAKGLEEAAKPKSVTLNGVPQEDFPVKGLKQAADLPKNQTAATKPKKLPPKAASQSKPVTLNGVPLKNFPAKGLEEAAGVPDVLSPARQSDGTPSATTGLAATPNASNKIPNPPTSSTNKKPQAHTGNKGSIAKSKESPQIKPGSKTTGTKGAARTAPKPTIKPKPESKTTKIKPNEAVLPAQPTTNLPPSSASATASGEVPEDKHDNAEVRRARKRLELRQGKSEPKRKTRRAVGPTASAS